MTYTFHISAKGHLLVTIGALMFAKDQPAVGAETRRRIAQALASARRDLRALEGKRKKRRRGLKGRVC